MQIIQYTDIVYKGLLFTVRFTVSTFFFYTLSFITDTVTCYRFDTIGLEKITDSIAHMVTLSRCGKKIFIFFWFYAFLSTAAKYSYINHAYNILFIYYNRSLLTIIIIIIGGNTKVSFWIYFLSKKKKKKENAQLNPHISKLQVDKIFG